MRTHRRIRPRIKCGSNTDAIGRPVPPQKPANATRYASAVNARRGAARRSAAQPTTNWPSRQICGGKKIRTNKINKIAALFAGARVCERRLNTALRLRTRANKNAYSARRGGVLLTLKIEAGLMARTFCDINWKVRAAWMKRVRITVEARSNFKFTEKKKEKKKISTRMFVATILATSV